MLNVKNISLSAIMMVCLFSLSCFAADKKLRGTIKVDGSSTVFPVTEAVAEEFQKSYPRVRVTVGVSGTGGGFKKFLAGETDISNASRPIKEIEQKKAKTEKIEYVELPVAYDGLAVIVSKKNKFISSVTVEELHKLWKVGSKIKNWNELRGDLPKKPIKLYGPGPDSGTFDYFTEAINGKAQSSRSDFSASEDDNALVQGIADDSYAIGYFGLAYYEENQDKLKLLAVDNGSGPVLPSPETVENGTYTPLSRPLFIYVRSKATDRPAVKKFVDFYLQNAAKLAAEVGYVALPKEAYSAARFRFDKKLSGTVFGSEKIDRKSAKLHELLKLEGH